MAEKKKRESTISETICRAEVKEIESTLGSVEKSLGDMRRELDGLLEKKTVKSVKTKGKKKSK